MNLISVIGISGMATEVNFAGQAKLARNTFAIEVIGRNARSPTIAGNCSRIGGRNLLRNAGRGCSAPVKEWISDPAGR